MIIMPISKLASYYRSVRIIRLFTPEDVAKQSRGAITAKRIREIERGSIPADTDEIQTMFHAIGLDPPKFAFD